MRARFGVRTMLIMVTLAGLFAALVAQPMYRYRMEQALIQQIGAATFDPNPAIFTIS